MKRLATVLAILAAVAGPSSAKADLARELRKTIGYTVMETPTIRTTEQLEGNEHLIVTSDGRAFVITAVLFLPPLPLTDMVMFGRTSKVYPNQIDILLLIDREVYQAKRLR